MMKKMMKMFWSLFGAALCAFGAFAAFAESEVTVTSVTAQQRYPWNGKVDIAVTFTCAAEDRPQVECTFAATNSATKAAIPVTQLTRNGDDTGSGTTWTRKYIWDAVADVGEVKIADVALTVDARITAVQLWENGPYWATCNVGAMKPEECGYYFWWGDTVGYKRNASDDGWDAVDGSRNGFLFSGNNNCPSHALSISDLQSVGYVDSVDNLTSSHDAATAHLGTLWRMPTASECEALINNCDTTWTLCNGVCGYSVEGRGVYSSRTIFLPAAGGGNGTSLLSVNEVGFYWTSTAYSVYAWDLGIHSGAFGLFYGLRDYGRSVRPVRGSRVAYSVKTVHLSLDSATNVYQVIFADGAKRTTEFYVANRVWKWKLPTSLFTPPAGKRFAGWACSNGRRYDDGMLVFDLAQPGETVTLTAIWE